MPTGYTAGVQDGTITTFDQFAMQCARGFGALVMMRDEPFSTPIPDRFEPKTEYSTERLAVARARLAELDAMTDGQAVAAALAEFEQAMADRSVRRAKREQDRACYEALLADVERWRPPSRDHTELKKFMRDQLRESITFDCGTDESFDRYYPVPELLSGPDWLATERNRARQDIGYHEQQIREEIERTEGRNEWLRALRASLVTEAAS